MAYHSLAILQEMFRGRLISSREDIAWLPHSPDLSPCDFFLWGYLKRRSRTLEELDETVGEKIAGHPYDYADENNGKTSSNGFISLVKANI